MRDKTLFIITTLTVILLWAFADYADQGLTPPFHSSKPDFSEAYKSDSGDENLSSIKVYVRTLNETARITPPRFGWKRCRTYWDSLRWRYYHEDYFTDGGL